MLKAILSSSFYRFIREKRHNFKKRAEILKAYKYDLKHYIKYSDTFESDSSNKLLGKIIREYHVIEKGLTMPKTRLGFGKNLIVQLINDCVIYYKRYGKNHDQFDHAISVVFEYDVFHKKNNWELDKFVLNLISGLKELTQSCEVSKQIDMKYSDYFKDVECSFPLFSNSRKSLRNFSDKNIDIETIIKALEISKNTPSACNRQCWRTYVFSDKNEIATILEEQGGNRGFGHLTNKLIVISADVSKFTTASERNEAYIDGGMYAMNLLYSLHYNKVGACILNCSNTVKKDVKMRQLCKIKDSEVFIAMVVCGYLPEDFKIAFSKRSDIKYTNILK